MSFRITQTFLICFLFTISVFASKKKEQLSGIDCIKYAGEALLTQDGHINVAFFVPDDDVQTILLGLIHNEKEKICTANFRMINAVVADALIDAHKLRNVVVELITDHSCLIDPHEKVSKLLEENILVRKFFSKSTIMHHKYWIFEKNFLGESVIVSGSANATISGLKKNQESMIITNKKNIIQRYKNNFELLRTRTTPVSLNNMWHLEKPKWLPYGSTCYFVNKMSSHLRTIL